MEPVNSLIKNLLIQQVYCIQDSHMQAMVASTMNADEVAVVFSYSGATKDTIHVAQLAKQAGALYIRKFLLSTGFHKGKIFYF